MKKTITFSLMALSLSTLGFADDYSSQQNPANAANRSEYELTQAYPDSDSRWYKSREGRQEYLKGGTDYPSGGPNNQNQVSPSDARWYKGREGRQEYLKGGTDYPYGQGPNNQNQVSPSDNRWYKSREGRQEYLKGGTDYPYNNNQYNRDQYNRDQYNRDQYNRGY